ncbi:alcohol acetyltransferase [Brachybacterium aquaticum]|uniref:Alcohol acetyltransferase n=1 Tax=Brachybacterium aquaticum TaxID=1432564 RepID=A0A841AGE4_9MICO|nr:alcohol acetyltransferase [Brachybacterium aquaticum]MBB5832405.1 hypothetical protein [Brachybacterium aquaticum]
MTGAPATTGHRRHWVRLDNASNIFPAALSERDPKVFRMAAELDHEVDSALLQEALDETYARYPLYRAVLRRGVFWYYLQDSTLHPRVEPEREHTCAPIYRTDHRTLLFRVTHHGRRVNLETFHALSDGTGALWFLTDLLTAYVRRLDGRDGQGGREDPSADGGADHERTGSAAHPDPAPARAGTHPGAEAAEEVHELTTDSFAHYFRRRRGRDRAPSAEDEEGEFEREAAPAVLTVRDPEEPEEGALEADAPPPRPERGRVFHVRGPRTPDFRPRLVELTMPVGPVLALAKSEGVAMTMYLTAMFFEAIRRSAPSAEHAAMAASVPVNLRQFFPSTSARNFFATIRVAHRYRAGEDDAVGAVARALQEDFALEATPAALAQKLHRLIRVERLPVARVVPRPLKDVLLGLINHANNSSLTVAVSNLGRVTLPPEVEAHVGRMFFHVSAVRPQFCAISHAGQLTISFTSPFTAVDHVREYVRMLAEAGADVQVAVPKVTERELTWGAP